MDNKIKKIERLNKILDPFLLFIMFLIAVGAFLSLAVHQYFLAAWQFYSIILFATIDNQKKITTKLWSFLNRSIKTNQELIDFIDAHTKKNEQHSPGESVQKKDPEVV